MTEIIIAIALFGVAGTAAMVLTLVIPTVMENMPAVPSAKAKIIENQARDLGKTQEIEMALDEVRGLDTEVSRWERELRALLEKRSQFPRNQPLPTLEIGQPLLTNKMFEAYVHNTALIRARRMREAPPGNPFWEEPRYVIIWSEDINTARAELMEKFPAQLEWRLDFGGEVQL